MTVLERLAEFAVEVRLESLPDAERDILRLHIADAVAAAIAGRALDEARALAELFAGGGADGGALDGWTLDAVAIRCGTARMTEIDDIHLPSGTTPGSIVVPAALTLAGRLGASPADFAGAVVAGYELLTRLGAAIDGPSVLYRGIWPTYFCAPMGVAAVAARLLGLAADETAHALALALAMTTGAAGRPAGGLSSRWLVAANAARAGCLAAAAAARGYRGDTALLDGGWLEATHAIEPRAALLTDGLGAGCVFPGLSIKPYCTAKQVMAALDAFQRILAGGVAAADIAAIRVFVPGHYRAMIDHGVVAGVRLSSIASAPYQLALAALRPDGLSDIARDSFVTDPDFLALMEKVSVTADDALAVHFPQSWPARVAVETAAGTETVTVTQAPGDPELRYGSDDEAAKLRRFRAADADALLADAAAATGDAAALTRLTARLDAAFS